MIYFSFLLIPNSIAPKRSKHAPPCASPASRNSPPLLIFSTFTEALSTAGRVGLDGAAGQGQARYNNDMGRAHEYGSTLTVLCLCR